MKRVKMEDWICKTENLPGLTRENLEQLQLSRLNSMLGRLKARGGIYKDLPESLSSLEELKNLPFTEPSQLREHPERFLSCSQSQVSRIISQQSSGTTGGVKRVFYSDADLKNTVDFFASGISEMLGTGEKCLIAFPFTGPSGLGDLIAKAVEKLGAVPLKTVPNPSYAELCRFIKDEQPETYIGFPLPLLSVLRLYEGYFPIKRALISGDACPESVFKGLSERLLLYPHYGSRETALGGAVTCPAFEGMHLRENHIIAEIVDEAGSPLPPGSWGELVITTIGLEAMPLLRYKTGDISRILPEPCPCGGVTKRLDRVIRKEDGSVSIEALDSRLFAIPDLIDYRLSFDGRIYIEALAKGRCFEIKDILKELYPDFEADVKIKIVSEADHPAYPGKRHVISISGVNK